MKKATLYIVSGANGSGKTTFAQLFIKQYNFPFINADELAKSINPLELEKASISAGRLFFEKTDEYLSKKKSVVIESTLSGKYLKKIIEKAKSLSYEIHIIYIFLDPFSSEINIQRVAARVLTGGHNVPKKDIIRRFDRSKKLFWNDYRYICNKWILFCNASESFEEIANWNGTNISIVDNPVFEKFTKGMNEL